MRSGSLFRGGGDMPISAEKFGERLRIARESRGLTQSVAAVEIGLQNSAISLMESGKRQVSTLELMRLAELYGRPVEWFVNPDAPLEDPVLALFRAEPSLEDEVVEKQARHCIHLFSVGASLANLLGRVSTSVLPRHELPEPRSTGLAIVQGQDVANQERRRLGLGRAPIFSIPRLIGSQGIWVAALQLSDEVSGLFLRSLEFGMGILVNEGQSPVRKRFSYAHEYGHVLMDRDHPTTVTSRHNAKQVREQRANAFAAAFLIPGTGARDYVHDLGKGRGSRREKTVVDSVEERVVRGELRVPPRSQHITYPDVALFSRNFGVSYSAAVWRLRGLNIISGHEAETLLEQADMASRYLDTVKTGEILEGEESRVPAEASGDHDLKWQILPLALEAWRREEISQDRLLEIGRLLRIEDEMTLDLAGAVGL